MTREPFIAHSELTNEIYIVSGREKYLVTEQAVKAVKAIKALEQEPTTKNNLGVDCISRTRAIERLKLNFPISQGADNSRDRHRYMQALADLQAIKELPPVTPQEPKTGHWIDKQHLFGSCSAECSSCHKRSDGFVNDSGFSLEYKYYDFCPNCGSRNVVEEQGEAE